MKISKKMLNYFVTFKQFTIHLMTRLSQCFSYSPLIHTELEENLTQLIQKGRNDE